ncbi:MAG TPA: 50S ribosomal protein L18 [bacterium]|nr:50S ribosomal protein L18 [bacterium]
MNKIQEKNTKLARRHKKIRSVIKGTINRPRLSVFRSNKGMYVQLIDDTAGKTLVSVNIKELGKDLKDKKVDQSFKLGKLLADKAKDKKITEIVFDRGGYRYHGRVKAVADGAREGGLIF